MTDSALERSFDSLSVGEAASLQRTIHASDVDAFAALCGDMNPLHVDAAYAATTPFQERVVHGMLLGSYVSALVGMKLPGRSALIVKEELEFKKPVSLGSTVIIAGRIAAKSEATRILEISITISAGAETVAEGCVMVRVRP